MPVQTIKAFAAFALFSCLSLATMLGCVQTKNIQVAPIIETETLVSAAPTVAKQAAIATESPPKKAIVKEEAAPQNFQGTATIYSIESAYRKAQSTKANTIGVALPSLKTTKLWLKQQQTTPIKQRIKACMSWRTSPYRINSGPCFPSEWHSKPPIGKPKHHDKQSKKLGVLAPQSNEKIIGEQRNYGKKQRQTTPIK